MRHRTGLRLGLPLLVGAVLLTVAGPSYARVGDPDYELPFPCGQKWTGTTRSSHSPSPRALDFNRPKDINDLVTVSAAGTVSRVANLGSRSYGRYVVIDHGDLRSTVYAHLNAVWVTPGQAVDQGMVLGLVGDTGNVTGPHLHFEERVGSDVAVPFFHATRFVIGSTQASASCPDVPVAGDWNADGKGDVGTFRRTASASFLRAGLTTLRFGRSTDDPVVGDWDGNGSTDPGVRRGRSGAFLLARPDGTLATIRYGTIGDRPVAGDWDGDGKDEVGVYRPATSQYLLRSAAGTSTTVAFGKTGALPVTGDWNGDGRTDLGLFEPATATWTLRYVDADGTTWASSVVFGKPGDLPATGDWDGDGRANLATWTAASAWWTLRSGTATEPTARIISRVYGAPRT